MYTISYTAIRARLAEKMTQVCEDHSPLVITRSGQKPVIMLSLEDYESMEETCYLIKNPVNAARLVESMDEIEALIAKKKKSRKTR